MAVASGGQVGPGRAAHAGDLRSEGLGELHGVGAGGRAGDQYVLSWPEAPGVTQALQGGQPGDRDDRGPGEGEAGRLAGELVRADARTLASAAALIGAVPGPVPFWPATLTQAASSFVNRVSPANVGGMALNARFLQNPGFPPPPASQRSASTP